MLRHRAVVAAMHWGGRASREPLLAEIPDDPSDPRGMGFEALAVY